ncbi:MAG: ferredoxin [Acidobacteriota bacterium]|nr:ferredoxin [Acidobacteriota bacterium]
MMVNAIKKHPLNVKGKYYVDCNSCIDHCCYDIAPANFKLDEESYQTYVFKQPETPEEEKLCEEVVLYCPVEAVHDDGEE